MSGEEKLSARALDHRLGSLIERMDASSRSISETTRNPGMTAQVGDERHRGADAEDRSYRRGIGGFSTDEEGSFRGGPGLRRVNSFFTESDSGKEEASKSPFSRRVSWKKSIRSSSARLKSSFDAHTGSGMIRSTKRTDTFGSKLMDEEERSNWKTLLLHPASIYARAWTRAVNVMILIICFTEPAIFAFRGDRRSKGTLSWNEIMEIPFVIIFLTDIIINFYRPIEEYSRLVWDTKKIAYNYLTGWFFIDFLASIPLDLMFADVVTPGSASSKILAGLGLLRILRLYRIKQMMSELEGNPLLPYLSFVSAKFALLIALASHWSACTLYFLASLDDFGEGTWVHAYDPDLPSMSFRDKYTTSLYWATVTLTTVGYGDISPVSNAERAISMIIMISNMGVTAYILGNMTRIVTKEDSHIMDFRENMSALSRFMKRNSIPDTVRDKINAHVSLEFEMKCRDDEAVLNFCPPTIQAELRQAIYQDYIDNCFIFGETSAVFTQHFLDCIKVEYFYPGTLLTSRGLDARTMYYLCLGKVDIITEAYLDAPSSSQKVAAVSAGDWLNITSVLCGRSCFHTSLVQSTCKVLAVQADKLQNVLERYPADLKHIMSKLTDKYTSVTESNSPDKHPLVNDLYSVFLSALHQKSRELSEKELNQLNVSVVTGDVAALEVALSEEPQNVHVTDAGGRSLLVIAIENKQQDIVKLLLKYGADPNQATKAGFSPLARAVAVGNPKVIEILTASGAEFTQPDDHTILHAAIMQDQVQRVKLLLSSGVSLNNQDYHGSTPLHVAAWLGSNIILKILLAGGANPKVEDKDGRTPKQVARNAGNVGCMKILEEYELNRAHSTPT